MFGAIPMDFFENYTACLLRQKNVLKFLDVFSIILKYSGIFVYCRIIILINYNLVMVWGIGG